MFDINGPEFLVLGAVALFVLGPDKLPGYAAQASRLLRQLRTMADGAKEQVREQLGPEFDDVDWKSLDPRQYDPRRIVRDALSGDDDRDRDGARPEKPVSRGGPSAVEETVADEGAPERPAQPSAYDEDAT